MAWPTAPATLKTPSVGFESLSDVSTNAITVLVTRAGDAPVAVMWEAVHFILEKFQTKHGYSGYMCRISEWDFACVHPA